MMRFRTCHVHRTRTMCRDAIHRVRREHLGILSDVSSRPQRTFGDLIRCISLRTRCNHIAILTQFAFGRKMYYLCTAQARRTARNRPFFVFVSPFQGETGPMMRFRTCHVGRTTWHVVFPGSACRTNYQPCTRRRMCMKVKNVKVETAVHRLYAPASAGKTFSQGGHDAGSRASVSARPTDIRPGFGLASGYGP